MSRVISGLVWAKPVARPSCIPTARPRKKCKLAGLKYEKSLAGALPQAIHGQWFQFQDRNGLGHCQTDLLLDCKLGIVVLESKYTWTEAGHKQVEKLYLPVLAKAYPGRNVLGIVVCKVLTRDTPRGEVCQDLDSAIKRAFCGGRTVLHWIGAGLGPFQPSAASLPLALTFASL